YVDSPILPRMVSMFIVLLCYWLVSKWASRSRTMEKLIEGSVVQVLCNGLVNIEALKKEGMTPHEFYGELRVQHVEHLGQVKSAYIEIDGEVSVFFQPDDAVQYGLPIAPELIRSRIIPVRGPVACAGCGSVHGNLQSLECTRCGTDHWIEASNAKRQS
ncbi:MAG: DUF421 domain-containing protein, partial [Flavobacteriales bacterium]|nr:DUF421 domain-containing protein [Flavobacteriales bacterium]